MSAAVPQRAKQTGAGAAKQEQGQQAGQEIIGHISFDISHLSFELKISWLIL